MLTSISLPTCQISDSLSGRLIGCFPFPAQSQLFFCARLTTPLVLPIQISPNTCKIVYLSVGLKVSFFKYHSHQEVADNKTQWTEQSRTSRACGQHRGPVCVPALLSSGASPSIIITPLRNVLTCGDVAILLCSVQLVTSRSYHPLFRVFFFDLFFGFHFFWLQIFAPLSFESFWKLSLLVSLHPLLFCSNYPATIPCPMESHGDGGCRVHSSVITQFKTLPPSSVFLFNSQPQDVATPLWDVHFIT